jgi:hypothetical protein
VWCQRPADQQWETEFTTQLSKRQNKSHHSYNSSDFNDKPHLMFLWNILVEKTKVMKNFPVERHKNWTLNERKH